MGAGAARETVHPAAPPVLLARLLRKVLSWNAEVKTMRIPKNIRPGDTIGLVAPSFGATIEPYITRLQSAIERFEARGYHVVAAPSCYKDDGIGISTDPADAASDLTSFYLDPSIDALISVGGGELMNETITHLDFEALADAPPKWFMGYSDNTNFLHPMATIGNVAGIYGPCATGFGKEWEATEEDAFALLEGTKSVFFGYDKYERPEDGDRRKEDPLSPYILTQKKELTTYPSSDAIGSFTGTLLGGCLDVLANLAGTKFDRTKHLIEEGEPIIWVLEACDLSVISIRRALWNLKMCGWFDTAAGFLIGRPLAAFSEEAFGVDRFGAVTSVLGDLGVPIILDADIGHISPMLPVIFGAEATVLAKGNTLSIAYG